MNSVPLESIRKYARRAWRFMDAYRKGLTGVEPYILSKNINLTEKF